MLEYGQLTGDKHNHTLLGYNGCNRLNLELNVPNNVFAKCRVHFLQNIFDNAPLNSFLIKLLYSFRVNIGSCIIKFGCWGSLRSA